MTAGMPAGTAVAATGGVAAGAFRFNHGNNNQSYDRNKDYTYDYCSHKKTPSRQAQLASVPFFR